MVDKTLIALGGGVLTAFAIVWTGSPMNVKRELLIGFDLLLVVVSGSCFTQRPHGIPKPHQVCPMACNWCSC